MSFDPKKPVRTRDGRAARIICEDAVGEQPIVALVRVKTTKGPIEITHNYSENGRYYISDNDCVLDLVNIPERKSYWVNVYYDKTVGSTWYSLEDLKKSNTRHAAGVIELVFEDDNLVEVIKHDVTHG